MTDRKINIDSIHIDNARKMSQLTQKSRIPARPGQSMTTNLTQKWSSSPKVAHHVSVPALSTKTSTSSHNSCSNPQCDHCGSVIVPAPVATLPLTDAPSISIGNWEVFTTRKPILNSQDTEQLEKTLGFPIPEMTFGHNKVQVFKLSEDRSIEWSIDFNAIDALKMVRKNVDPSELLQVSYAQDWVNARQHRKGDEIMEIFRPFDWSYTSDYKGTITSEVPMTIDNSKAIPTSKLQTGSILFFNDMILFEDELGDNGISLLNIKIRVMKDCLLILQRLFLRVDNVIFRVYDTRVYIDFEKLEVIREFKRLEASYQEIRLQINVGTGDPRALMRDTAWVADHCKEVFKEREYVQLSG
ncbi:Type 2A phosphatase regulator [Komagataella phaffii CBS 7435]|uniref:Protein that interacts physically and genetically with Tap42p, which regulates protein phosphatase 2 n=2 Tax=Komagataella phaffii TaxID=460519 RepID=C4R491_KOMPG|nr:Protein that interacts physically and genetically with Tap42p, which regulates protein phosphatase 2 [Komagataella phaffii GS115]AOA63767.1 GQ67_03398T0 [Komagataella phaffii]CAH2449872.1 Type 2A phosphatase regulator [Komagataella phaffii CBS 7435]AOA68235.1 GQ68_03367T0 [Komagataella phaffii GS115]CAY70377.1 Protein that interacts physically and genetically with Tap42p, which regulates protein phosphatase 2 [Komagataella phaffii GS115]CCA39829.1 Type 2A phosphatase regulator [Komagataella